MRISSTQGSILRLMHSLRLLVIIACCIGHSPGKTFAGESPSAPDSSKFALQLDSLTADNARLGSRLDQMSDSLWRVSDEVARDLMRWPKFLIAFFGIMVGVCGIVMGMITFSAKKQLDESKEALRAAEEARNAVSVQLRELVDRSKDAVAAAEKAKSTADDQLRSLARMSTKTLEDVNNYSWYLSMLLMHFVPGAKKLNPSFAQYALDLFSSDRKQRFVAINALRASRDPIALPFLEWVRDNRPDSARDAQSAIDELTKTTPAE